MDERTLIPNLTSMIKVFFISFRVKHQDEQVQNEFAKYLTLSLGIERGECIDG